MRWGVLMFILLMHLCTPLVHADSNGRDSAVADAIAPTEVVVHPNETVQTYITVHNKDVENQVLTVNVLNAPAPLTVLNLPRSELLVPNHLRQITFEIRAPASAAYQNITASFSITSDTHTDFNETIEMNIMIAPWSNLTYGVDDYAAFTVDEKIRTAVAVNISNNASLQDNVTFSLYSTSSWNWGWDMPNLQGANAYEIIEPDQLVYVYLWIDVPAVENGAPLAQTGPRFVLSATSSLDHRVVEWSFDLLMNVKKNASIDDVETDLVVAPNTDGRLNVNVRNVGNTPNTINITLQGVSPTGDPLTTAADRFNSNGWVVALFGGLEDVELQPNESRTIEIGFQSPNVFQGEIFVEVRVFAEGAIDLLQTARLSASISRTANATATWGDDGCSAILPNQTCTVSLTVRNTGNAYDTMVLRTGEVTDGFEVIVPDTALLLQTGEQETFPPVVIRAEPDAVAFKLGNAELEVLGDNGNVLTRINVPLKVAPEIKWTFRNIEESVNAKGRLSIAMEVRNEGNAIDGLIVQLQSSHTVDMGFIPPDIAIYEEGVEFPRSFEINDIPLNSNFTIRAWVDLPQDQSTNGTVFINTTIRSRFAPEMPFVHTSTGDYLGIAWQPAEEQDEGLDWSGMASTAVLYLQAWFGVLLAILFAGLIIYKAVIDREKRLGEQALLPYQETPKQAEDWMQQFERDEPETVPLVDQTKPLVAVPKETYEAMFRHTHGAPSVAQSPVDTALVDAATVVLDKRTEDAMKSKADDLLGAIQTGDVATPLGASEVLNDADASLDVSPTVPSTAVLPEDDLEF